MVWCRGTRYACTPDPYARVSDLSSFYYHRPGMFRVFTGRNYRCVFVGLFELHVNLIYRQVDEFIPTHEKCWTILNDKEPVNGRAFILYFVIIVYNSYCIEEQILTNLVVGLYLCGQQYLHRAKQIYNPLLPSAFLSWDSRPVHSYLFWNCAKFLYVRYFQSPYPWLDFENIYKALIISKCWTFWKKIYKLLYYLKM